MLRALVAVGMVASVAQAAPRVGVVVVSKEGLTEEQADSIAADVAAAVSTQIEGEAIAGSSVRGRLPPGTPADGCEEQPTCGRDIASTLAVDETLLLAMHLAGTTIVVSSYRVPRDPARPASDRTLRLMGNKAKRTEAIMEFVTVLYPSGSVLHFDGPSATPAKPTPAEGGGGAEQSVDQTVHKAKRAEPERTKTGRPKWLLPAVAGGAALVVVVVAVILGVAFGTTASPTGPAIMLP